MFDDSSTLFILAIIAGVILYKLYSLLGQREEGEVYPYKGQQTNGEVVIDLGAGNYSTEPDTELSSKKLKTLIDEIKLINNKFTLKHFLKGANNAFEMIISSFNDGDKKSLKDLTTREVFKEFEKDINSRKRKNRFPHRTIVSIKSANLVSGKIEKNMVKLSVEFITEQIFVEKDIEGIVIEGDPSYIEEMKDVWTFQKNIKSSSPVWLLESTS